MMSPPTKQLSSKIICLLLVLEKSACLKQNPSKATVSPKLSQQQHHLHGNKQEIDIRHHARSLHNENLLRDGRGTDESLDEGRGASAEEKGCGERGNLFRSSNDAEGVGLAEDPSRRVE